MGRSASNSDEPGSSLSMSVTQAEFRKVLGCFAIGVTVITADPEGEVHSMIANAFTPVALDAPVVGVDCWKH